MEGTIRSIIISFVLVTSIVRKDDLLHSIKPDKLGCGLVSKRDTIIELSNVAP